MWITYAEVTAQKLTKNEQKSAIIDHTNTFASKNPSKHCQIKILLIARKATIQSLRAKYEVCVLHVVQVMP